MSDIASGVAPARQASDLADLYDNAPCAYLSLAGDGVILRANATFAGWVGIDVADLIGRRFPTLLSVGTRLFYETNAAPNLRLQGRINEVALELIASSATRLPVFAHGTEHVDAAGQHHARLILVRAGERRRWERELIEARRTAEASLSAEVDTSQLREQFIAVLGHDLRNPVASIAAGLSLLTRTERLGPEATRFVELMRGSVDRMSAIINDVMDFARGRLGGGASLSVVRQVDLNPVLVHLVEEQRLSSGRAIEADIAIAQPVDCDPSRVGQLVANLIGNALTHGAQDMPVTIEAADDAGRLLISVSNGGLPIPATAMARLFHPFVWGQERGQKEGLGLGLYIASEIATAHGGTLDVSSTAERTRFVLNIPVRQAPELTENPA